MDRDLMKEEEKTYNEDDSPEIPPSDIVAYNELRSCADLYRMYEDKILNIQPEFQREKVWGPAEQTRFIDSLTKQLPIPSMCFSLDYKTQNWQVIDGLQRMWSIIRFLSGDKWKLSDLEDIDPSLAGKDASTFRDPNSNLNIYYKRVENLSLPITVLRCNYEKENHTQYLFTIFHRLNTGGQKLNNQEIRNCIYQGDLNRLLKELDENETWTKIHKIGRKKTRFKYQELTLRVFAFSENLNNYKGRLAKFLNDYMKDNKNPSKEFLDQRKRKFEETVDIIWRKIFDSKTLPKISLSVLEALLIGVFCNVDKLKSKSKGELKKLYKDFSSNKSFNPENLKQGLSDKARVIERLETAINIFRG